MDIIIRDFISLIEISIGFCLVTITFSNSKQFASFVLKHFFTFQKFVESEFMKIHIDTNTKTQQQYSELKSKINKEREKFYKKEAEICNIKFTSPLSFLMFFFGLYILLLAGFERGYSDIVHLHLFFCSILLLPVLLKMLFRGMSLKYTLVSFIFVVLISGIIALSNCYNCTCFTFVGIFLCIVYVYLPFIFTTLALWLKVRNEKEKIKNKVDEFNKDLQELEKFLNAECSHNRILDTKRKNFNSE